MAEVPDEETTPEEEIAAISLMMQKAFGRDVEAAGQINAWIEALKGETPMPVVLPEQGAPDVYAFGVPMQTFVNRQDAWQDLTNLAETVKGYPGADIGGKAFIKTVFPSIDEASVQVWWEQPGFAEGLRDKTPGQDITMFISSMLETVNEMQLETAIAEQEKRGEAAAFKTTAERPFPAAVEIYPFPTTAVTSLTTKDEAYNRLANMANRLNLANQDISWALDGVFQTYLPQSNVIREGGITRREQYFGLWEENASRELLTAGDRAAKLGVQEGFVALQAGTVAQFYDIVSSFPRVGMDSYMQLDLLRSIPRVYSAQDSADLVSHVLDLTVGANADRLSTEIARTGVDPMDALDQAIASASLQEMKRAETLRSMAGTKVEQRLGLEAARPLYMTTGYKARMGQSIDWFVKRTFEKLIYPTGTPFTLSSLAAREEGRGKLVTIPSLPERREPGEYVRAIEALFPSYRRSGEAKAKKEPEEEAARRKGMFPALIYRPPEW